MVVQYLSQAVVILVLMFCMKMTNNSFINEMKSQENVNIGYWYL